MKIAIGCIGLGIFIITVVFAAGGQATKVKENTKCCYEEKTVRQTQFKQLYDQNLRQDDKLDNILSEVLKLK
ncbi:MAG: hypothetical protein GY861_14660 [bacterium]|nr:hypothetical protein [bacterium]